MDGAKDNDGPNFHEVFIEIAMRAIRKTHIDYATWALGPQPELGREARARLNNAHHGLEDAYVTAPDGRRAGVEIKGPDGVMKSTDID